MNMHSIFHRRRAAQSAALCAVHCAATDRTSPPTERGTEYRLRCRIQSRVKFRGESHTSEYGRVQRAMALILSALIALPVMTGAASATPAASAADASAADISAADTVGESFITDSASTQTDPKAPADVTIQASLLGATRILTPADPDAMTAELLLSAVGDAAPDLGLTQGGASGTNQAPNAHPDGSDGLTSPSIDEANGDRGNRGDRGDRGDRDEDEPDDPTPEYEDLFDPDLPLTQELIARRIETRMNMQVRGGSRITYPYPAGAMAVDLYKDGKRILAGQVADIGGTVYVPVQRFADLFGSFKTTYIEATEEVFITGKNLSISVKVGDPYILVNERVFYSSAKVISLGGWIFVPLTSMCKALDADVTIRKGYYDAFITSGDPSTVPWAEDYYDETDLYWLSRIISAEARGESFTGQIAVGNVVLNRVRSSQFPNTVKGVIFDTKYGIQFSPVAGGTIYQTPTDSAIRAAKVCLEGYSLSSTIIYFYNPAIATSTWIGRTRPYVMTVGNHKFYA